MTKVFGNLTPKCISHQYKSNQSLLSLVSEKWRAVIDEVERCIFMCAG